VLASAVATIAALLVHQGRESRAYLVRSISYHHVINDLVDGKAIVATY